MGAARDALADTHVNIFQTMDTSIPLGRQGHSTYMSNTALNVALG